MQSILTVGFGGNYIHLYRECGVESRRVSPGGLWCEHFCYSNDADAVKTVSAIRPANLTLALLNDMLKQKDNYPEAQVVAWSKLVREIKRQSKLKLKEATL